MKDIGLSAEAFNPKVLYVSKHRTAGPSKVATHKHDFASVICVLSGACTYNIGNESYPAKKGNVIVLNPGVSHGKTLAQNEEVNEFHIGFSNIYIKNLPRDYLIGGDNCPVVSLSKYEADFFKCCNEIIAEQEKNDPGLDLIIKSQVMRLIAILLKSIYIFEPRSVDNGRYGNLSGFEPNDRTNIVNSILMYINENYMKNISLDKISRNTYLSPVYISKIFKEETGDSPINHLIKVRLSKAKELLEQGNTSVKAVSKSVGYHDAYYFSKLFKKYYGLPPSKLLKDNSL